MNDFQLLFFFNFRNFFQSDDEPVRKKLKSDLAVSSNITDEQHEELKKFLKERTNALKSMPAFRLKSFGEKANLSITAKKRQPLMLEDIQHLLMSALAGQSSPFRPDRWCVLERPGKVTHTVILLIEGLSSYNFMANESRFVKTKGIFEHQLEVLLPKHKMSLLEELCYVPLTQSFKEKLIKKYGSIEAAMLNKDHHLINKTVFPIEGDAEDSFELVEGETFPRTRLLLSPLQMMIEGYPMPLSGEFAERYRAFRYSRTKYTPVTAKSPMFGLDCEMCRTSKAENELTRVSIVDENYQSVYETLVRPSNPIVDYLTPWSGITKEMMQDVTKTLEQVQKDVSNVLPSDAILVGQSLNCDLSAMKLMHPYVIDTSVIFNISGDRNRKSKLQVLAKAFLDEDIQMKSTGHNSIEDSTASLKLTKLKLSKDIYFGDTALQEKQKINESITYKGIVEEAGDAKDQHIATTVLSQAFLRRKKSAIVTTHRNDIDLSKFYSKHQFDNLQTEDDKQLGFAHHKETSAKKVISKTREIMIDNDFNLSHFNILEDHECEGDSGISEDDKLSQSIDKVDKWIEKVWSSVALNGLFLVIFGGNSEKSNGLSMIRIKN